MTSLLGGKPEGIVLKPLNKKCVTDEFKEEHHSCRPVPKRSTPTSILKWTDTEILKAFASSIQVYARADLLKEYVSDIDW